MSKANKREERLKKLEEGFDLNGVTSAKLKSYNALLDPNMRHYFENPKLQKLLYESGQIDKHGRVIDFERNKSKVNVLENEFKKAEYLEQKRQQEEMEMRYRVQRKRFAQLEQTRREEILRKYKDEQNLSKEILSTIRTIQIGSPSRGSTSSLHQSGRLGASNSAFFVTEQDK